MDFEQKTVSERNEGHLWPLSGNLVDSIAKDQQSGPSHPARSNRNLDADRVYQRKDGVRSKIKLSQPFRLNKD